MAVVNFAANCKYLTEMAPYVPNSLTPHDENLYMTGSLKSVER